MRAHAISAITGMLVSVAAPGAVSLLDEGSWNFSVGGFVQMDTTTDTTGSFTEVVGNNPVARPGTLAANTNRTQFSPRNSRVSFGLSAPAANGWESKGFLEFDLLGYNPPPGPGQSESSFYTNPTLRLRHAFLQAERDGWRILAGQTWSLFGWQPYYVLTTVSVPPVSGVLYERALQVTTVKTFSLGGDNTIQAGASLVRPVQRQSGVPGLDVGTRLAFGHRRGGFAPPNGDITSEAMSLGLSASGRDLSNADAAGHLVHYLGSAVAVDLLVPILATESKRDVSNTLTFTAEASAGQGYGDQFPGWNGNLGSIPNLDAGQMGLFNGAPQVVKLATFNASLQYHLARSWRTFGGVGYGQLRSPNAARLAPSLNGNQALVPYTRSEVAFVNVFHDFTNQLRAALEWDYFQTRYADNVWSHNNRVQATGWFRF